MQLGTDFDLDELVVLVQTADFYILKSEKMLNLFWIFVGMISNIAKKLTKNEEFKSKIDQLLGVFSRYNMLLKDEGICLSETEISVDGKFKFGLSIVNCVLQCQCTNLLKVGVSGMMLTQDEEGTLMNLIQKCNNLSSLNISTVALMDCDLISFPSGILHLKYLTSLNVCQNRCYTNLSTSVAALTNLTCLNMSRNHLGPQDAKLISSLKNLTTLNLNQNRIGDEGAKAISELINLEILHLSENEIEDAGAQYISKLKSLTFLDLSSNLIRNSGAEAISELEKLNHLDLSWNCVEEAGFLAICTKLSNLKTLEIFENEARIDNSVKFSKLNNLEKINLNSNQILENVEFVSQFTNITSLSIEKNEIGDNGAKVISELKSLVYLNINRNSITKEGAFFISQLKNLVNLNIGNNYILCERR